MDRRAFVILLIAGLLPAACEAQSGDWPARAGRTPEQMLLDVVQFQQRRHVRASVGESADQCFTDRDLASFTARGTPERIVERLKRAPDFAEVAAALRTLPPARLADAMRAASQQARPTWREMGFIDPEGRGQTEAGHRGELLISAAIVDAFAVEVARR
jgi:hypothetical protein